MFNSSEYPGSNARFQEIGKSNFTDSLERIGHDYHVLVVHSSPKFLSLMAAMFLKFGFRVTTARDSAKALLYFGRNPCDLLFIDLEKPVLHGYHLAHLLKKHRPQVKAVAMTCCCQAEIVDLLEDGIIDRWLFKPFKMNELGQALADVGLPAAHRTCFSNG
jgi:DNA-binding response OmpR family regulator